MMSGRYRAIFAAVGMAMLVPTGPVPAQTPPALRLAAAPPAAVSQPPRVPSATPKLERVIVTFKTHFDIGYTDLAANVVQRYRTEMIDQALEGRAGTLIVR